MADPYRTAALRASRRPSLYVPEENPEAVAAQEYAQSRYNELMDPYRKFKQGIIQDAYNRVLQQTGDPKQAEMVANSIAGRISRTELVGSVVAPEAALAGAGRSVGVARDLASRVMGGSRAAEAPGAMRALPPPRRNAIYPDEMLTPEVIYGTSAEGAPRLGFAKPETRYQMAVDRPAQGRPLTNYERPAIDETFVRPEDIRPFSAGNVRGTVDPLDVLAGEGGQSTEAVQLAQKIARDRAAGRAARLADEEARFAGGEGPNYAEDVLNRRRIAAGEEADFRANQFARMEEEGGGAGRQAAINNLNRQAEADFRARQMGTLDDESGAITSGRNPPQSVQQALQLTERRPPAAPPEFIGPPEMQGPRQVTPQTFIGPAERQGPPELIGPRQTPQMTLIEQLRSGQISGRQYQAAIDAQRASAGAPAAESPLARALSSAPEGAPADPVQAAINAAKQRADAMARSNADAAAQQAIIEAAAKRAGAGSEAMYPNYRPYSPPSLTTPLIGAGAIGAGTAALISGSQQAQPTGQAPSAAVGPSTNVSDFSRLDYVAPPATDVARFSQMDFVPPATRAAVQQAKTQTASMSPTRPSDSPREQGSSGILSKIFGQPATTRQLFEQSQADPSDSGAWMRAERQYARTHKDDPNFDVTKLNDQGMKRGGAASKPDSVHKALEIIHHLISSR